MRRVAKILIVLSTTTLFFRREIVYFFKPFEILIIGAVFCILVYALQTKENPFKKIPHISLWLILFFCMFLWSAIGTINGYRLYGIADPIKTVGGFFYLGIGMAAFLLTLYYGSNAQFRTAVRASFLSSLIFTPLIFLPDLTEKLGFISDTISFQGLHKNPTTFAFLAFMACIVLIENYFRTDKKDIKIFCWLGAIGMLSLYIWTGSRAAWLALALSFTWIALHKSAPSITGRILPLNIKRLSILFLAGTISAIISFAILPHRTKIMAIDRFYPQISGIAHDYELFNRIPLKTALNALIRFRPSLPYQSRQSLWPQAFALFIKNPLGLGMEYFRSAKAIYQNNTITHSHNTILQIGLTGGIGLIVTCLFFLSTILASISRSKKDDEWLTLSAMLIGSFIFLMIGEYFYTIPWLWVIAALACAKANDTTIVPTP